MREARPGCENVSRETLDKLSVFEGLVRKWTPRINLVSPADLEVLWDRHITDSAQLLKLSSDPSDWLDIGSGGGFPGMIIAIIAHAQSPAMRVTLVESDRRKSAFLRTAARSLDLSLDICAERIEHLPPQRASTLTARALGPLTDILSHADRHLDPDGTALFPKGENWRKELRSAKEKWSFDCDVIQSVTHQTARILRIRNIQRI